MGLSVTSRARFTWPSLRKGTPRAGLSCGNYAVPCFSNHSARQLDNRHAGRHSSAMLRRVAVGIDGLLESRWYSE
jgi:hypothetical protein